LYSEIALARLKWLISRENPAVRTLAFFLRGRAASGAAVGGFLPFLVLGLGGAVWGAWVRAAPCYGGGEPTAVDGALFGWLASLPFSMVLSLPGAVTGALVATFLWPRQH
jgi:hypothetical protein